MLVRKTVRNLTLIMSLLIPAASCKCAGKVQQPPAAQNTDQKATVAPSASSVLTPAPVQSTKPAIIPIAPLTLSCLPGGKETAQAKLNEVRTGFMKLFGNTLSGGTIILNKPNNNEAVSEGVGFGGKIYGVSGGLAAGALTSAGGKAESNQQTFWQIYRARNAYFMTGSGVMAWKVDGQGKQISTDSAADGDQDWIAAEQKALDDLQAGQWQLPAGITIEGIKTQIQTDRDAFWRNHVKPINGRLFFLASNGAWAKRGDGREIYYPSYPDPNALGRIFRSDSSHDGAKLVADVQALNQEVLANYQGLGASGQNPMPAKVFVTVLANGSYKVENYYEISGREGVRAEDRKDNELDSIRFFLRQGRAALLDGDAAAQTMLRQIIQIAKITGPSTAHILAGAQGAPSPLGFNNTLARASYGLAVLGSGESAKAESFFCSVMNDHKGQYFGEWDGAKKYYYDQAMIIQALDLAIN